MAPKTKTCLFLGLSFFFFFFFVSLTEAFDYLALAQQWPPTACKKAGGTPCAGEIPKRFTISGLWPKLYSGVPLRDCVGLQFQLYKMKSVRSQLNVQWPNLYKLHANNNFWKREWSRYGTCTYPYEQTRYFEKALELREKNDILGILNRAGLGPTRSGPGKMRNTKQVRAALKARVRGGVDVATTCIGVAGGKRRLHEIILCYGKDGVTPINCPARLNRCPPNILWLPLNSTIVPNDVAEDLDVADDLDVAEDLDVADDLSSEELAREE